MLNCAACGLVVLSCGGHEPGSFRFDDCCLALVLRTCLAMVGVSCSLPLFGISCNAYIGCLLCSSVQNVVCTVAEQVATESAFTVDVHAVDVHAVHVDSSVHD